MGSQTPTSLPVIYFTCENIKVGTTSWASTRHNVRRALEDYGCFEAVYDIVSPKLHDEICNAVDEMFHLPVEVKSRYTSDVPLYGYFGETPSVPLRESVGLKDPAIFEETQNFTNLMWPHGNDLFRDTVYSYSKLITELDEMVTRMVFEDYGVEKYYDPKSKTYMLRIMKYREPKANETNVGCGAHVDMSFTTILHQNQVSGLQVQTREGEWIEVKPTSTSSFVVMAGYPFKAWSNGRVHDPMHRVIMNENKERHSLAMFSFNTGIIQVPDELVDEEHPLLFKPFHHLDSLLYYIKNKGVLPK